MTNNEDFMLLNHEVPIKNMEWHNLFTHNRYSWKLC